MVGLGKAQGFTLILDAICYFCRVRQFLHDFVLENVVGDLVWDQKSIPSFFEKVIGAYIEAPLVEKIMS
ncbi:protein of unknown function (plasmid) [Bacillus velezensis]|nr:protein of unknown function [Bacillus velezensis]